jgi:hypothetical protein
MSPEDLQAVMAGLSGRGRRFSMNIGEASCRSRTNSVSQSDRRDGFVVVRSA